MVEQAGRTFICSVVFVDLVEFSRKSNAEQVLVKETCNALAAEALGKLLDRCERAAYDLSDEAHRRFFTHAGTPVPLGIEGA